MTFDLPEKFDTDLKTLQPPDEKHFLNPRLSISTRFLSRFQDRIRSAYPQSTVKPRPLTCRVTAGLQVPLASVTSDSYVTLCPSCLCCCFRASRAPPPVSIPTRISEESNISTTSVNAHKPVMQGACPHEEWRLRSALLLDFKPRQTPDSKFSFQLQNKFILQHFQATNNDTAQSTVSLHACGRFQSPASNLMLQECSMSCGHDL